MESPVRILIAAVEQLTPGRWRVTFRATNVATYQVHLEDAWLPHGRFRGDGHTPLALTVRPGEHSDLVLPVKSDEPVGTVVENAFLILRVHAASGAAWRVFVRMRVEFSHMGMAPVIETIAAHTLGDDAAVTR